MTRRQSRRFHCFHLSESDSDLAGFYHRWIDQTNAWSIWCYVRLHCYRCHHRLVLAAAAAATVIPVYKEVCIGRRICRTSWFSSMSTAQIKVARITRKAMIGAKVNSLGRPVGSSSSYRRRMPRSPGIDTPQWSLHITICSICADPIDTPSSTVLLCNRNSANDGRHSSSGFLLIYLYEHWR